MEGVDENEASVSARHGFLEHESGISDLALLFSERGKLQPSVSLRNPCPKLHWPRHRMTRRSKSEVAVVGLVDPVVPGVGTEQDHLEALDVPTVIQDPAGAGLHGFKLVEEDRAKARECAGCFSGRWSREDFITLNRR